MLVKDLMAQQVATVGPEEPVSVAARALSRNNVGCLPVCTADGRLRGVVTDRDIVLRSVAADEDAGQQLVREIMSRRLVTAAPEDPVALAVRRMEEAQVRRLPVTSRGRLGGMLSLGDVLHAPGMTLEAGRALEGISRNVRRG